MAAATETFVYTEIALPRWQATIPAAYRKGNRKERYVPFRVMCEVVGIERKRQLDIVKRRYRSALVTLAIETPAGPRPALWIRTGECALWIGNLRAANCAITKRGTLEEFKTDFTEGAERLMFDAPTPPAQRGMFAHSERMEYVFSCLACGAGHRIIAQNGEVTLERYEF